jgi:hypothetical protein
LIISDRFLSCVISLCATLHGWHQTAEKISNVFLGFATSNAKTDDIEIKHDSNNTLAILEYFIKPPVWLKYICP